MVNSRRLKSYGIAVVCAVTLTGLATAFQAPPAVDVSVFDVSDPGAPKAAGTLTARIRNQSKQPVATVVGFLRGSPLSGNETEVERKTIAMAAFTTVSIASSPLAMKEGDIFTVCVDPDVLLVDQNRNDNCETRTVSASAVDLFIATPNIQMHPVGVNVGEPVTVTATVSNGTPRAAKAVARLFQSHPESPAAKLLGQTSVSVAANGKGIASWTVLRPAGDTNLFVSIGDVVPRDTVAANNIASRNLFLKAILNTGRKLDGFNISSTPPVIGDLTGTGQPTMIFGEQTRAGTLDNGVLTALQLYSDGTQKQLWSKPLVPAPSQILTPSIADLDNDGSPEIIVEVSRNLTVNGVQDGEIHVFALDRNGATKWTRSWRTPGRSPCHHSNDTSTPAIGDMNGDSVADVVILERELVVLDGRTGGELVRKPGIKNKCSDSAFSAILDLDNNGTNEYIAGDFGIHVFNSDGTLKWEGEANNIFNFAVLDLDRDGTSEMVLPVHRQRFDILDAATGKLERRSTLFPPYDAAIAATTSLNGNGLPTLIVANNDALAATAALDVNLQQVWFQQTPINQAVDNPQSIVLADLMGTGRPQLISSSDRRFIGIQDSKDGKFLFYSSIYGGNLQNRSAPVPADLDGDGRGDIVVAYGKRDSATKLPYEPQYAPANYLVFGSVHWSKLPPTWNHRFFQAGQVDRKLAFRHDYKPWKTHNTWFQQPLRQACDIDFDEDIDQNDINEIFSARGTSIAAGDWRDIDRDGQITVADSRSCTLKCTLGNCTAINPAGRLLSVSPRNAQPAATISATIRGEFLGFKDGATVARFGPGIAVGGASAGAFGPVTVLDASTATARLTIAAGATGARSVTVATGSLTATREDAFTIGAGNRPPVVEAGEDVTLNLPGTISLSGTATDEGSVAVTWQQVAGPGVVIFGSSNALATTASFAMPGFYQIRLSATDGELASTSDIGVSVFAGNQAPLVSTGSDRGARLNLPLNLAADVTDDGLPQAGTVAMQWTKVSGPGTVTFANPNAASTGVSFSQTGSYVLKLSATDSQLAGADEIAIEVAPPLPALLSVSPDSGAPGQTRTVNLIGEFTNFAPGATQASFGAGVTAGPVTVTSATTATVQLVIAAGAALGTRTVTLKTGSEQASRPNAFFIGAAGVPQSIRLNLSKNVVAPDGTITAHPQVVDAAGNVLSNSAYVFAMKVTPKPGASFGNGPVVNGLSVRFPKLQKRTINQNPTADPEGEFADGDQSDVNFGKETGGLYQLAVTLQSPALTGTAEVAVLASGTANITLLTEQYADELGKALIFGRDAMTRNDAAALLAARQLFAGIEENPDFSYHLLRTNDVLMPPNGRTVTAAQLVAAGFRNGLDDTKLTTALDAIINQVRTVRARVVALNPASVTQADIDALRATTNIYKGLSAQLAALNPSPLGVTQNRAKLNTLLRIELPKLLDTIKDKSIAMLGVLPSSKQSNLRAASETDQFLTTFSNLFSIFTDLKGYAQGNIIELGISLANDLINIAIANVTNSLSEGSVAVDLVAGSGSLSFVCPNFINTYVEGTGFSRNAESMSVAQIGCINSYALRNLLTLKRPKDGASGIRIGFKIKALVEAVGQGNSIASFEYPDKVSEGLFSQSRLTFAPGWPRVNQSRIPCAGVVIVFNDDTGDFHAVNANILGSCGD